MAPKNSSKKEKDEVLTPAEAKKFEQPTVEEKEKESSKLRKENGVVLSPKGVQVFPAGEHPRDLRKEHVGETPKFFEAGFAAWLKEGASEVEKEIAKEDHARGLYLFQQAVSGVNIADLKIESTGPVTSKPATGANRKVDKLEDQMPK